MKGIKAVSKAAIVVLALGSASAFAQGVYEPNTPDTRTDVRSDARYDRSARTTQERGNTSSLARYDSQTPEGNSANWGVGN